MRHCQSRLHKRHLVNCIRDIEYTTHEALSRSHTKHWIYYIWSVEYTTYEALSRLHMKHWIDHIRSTEYTTYQALNILHMKHWGGSGVDSANLVLILHFLKILMGLSANSKKTIQVLHTTVYRKSSLSFFHLLRAQKESVFVHPVCVWLLSHPFMYSFHRLPSIIVLLSYSSYLKHQILRMSS